MTQHHRVYPLGAPLTEEQIAVTFAMTSRNPAPFDEIALQVSETRAAEFNERWVLGYGHASVAEHAIIHLAIEDYSRLAVDGIESTRLASYTEKSSRYQIIDSGSYWTPTEIMSQPEMPELYSETMDLLFRTYQQIMDASMQHLANNLPQLENESERAWTLRLRRIATDSVRAILPAATLTNVGITANARTLEHVVSKLMSATTQEEQNLGEHIRTQGRNIAPTLLKYADYNKYLVEKKYQHSTPSQTPREPSSVQTKLIQYDQDAPTKLVAALLFRQSNSYEDARTIAETMSPAERRRVIRASLYQLPDHNAPPREFETINYLFESVMDYGALREFRRHRMMTLISQQLTVLNGYHIPEIIAEQPAERDRYSYAIARAESLHNRLQQRSPLIAPYAVTHAHHQRILYSVNLRECYQLLRLRTSSRAHYGIREPMIAALQEIRRVHPQLVEPITPDAD